MGDGFGAPVLAYGRQHLECSDVVRGEDILGLTGQPVKVDGRRRFSTAYLMGSSPHPAAARRYSFPGEICVGGRASRRPVDPGKMTGPGGALIATILFIPLSAAQFNLEADWAEESMQAILRHCPICAQIPSSVMDAAANRRTIDTMIGSGFAAAFATGAARRSPSCHPFLLPTAITASLPAARRFGAASWKAVPGKPRRPPSKTPIAWPILPRCADGAKAWILLSHRFPSCARRSGLSARGSPEQRFSCTIRSPCAGTPYSRFSPGSGPCGFRTLPPPHHPRLGRGLLSA